MRQRIKQRIGLIAVFALFFIPVVTALFLRANPTLLGVIGTTNYGVLLPEARPVIAPNPESVVAVKRPEEALELHGKWSAVALDPGSCNEPCRTRLQALWTAHVATHKDIDRVARILLLPRSAPTVGDFVKNLPKEDGLQVFKVSEQWAQMFTGEPHPFSSTRVYLVDPRGFVFMYYDAPLDARDLLKDLKRLLKISKIG